MERVFYGEFLGEQNRFFFVGNKTAERVQVLQEMLTRAFAHSAICPCFQNIMAVDPQVYFDEDLLGTVQSIIDRLRNRQN
jgi:hypothetical protein